MKKLVLAAIIIIEIFFFKSLNTVLETRLVKIEICDKGKHWVNKNTSHKYNIKVTAGGYTSRTFLKRIEHDITPSEILRCVGKHLLIPEVKESIKSEVHLRSAHCCKCNGIGIIPQFYYYCSGICFDCGGTGFNLSNDKDYVNIKQNENSSTSA